MVATVDLWVYNSENFCVSLFNQVTSIFHLRGGKIKKKFGGAYLMHTHLFWYFAVDEFTKITFIGGRTAAPV